MSDAFEMSAADDCLEAYKKGIEAGRRLLAAELILKFRRAAGFYSSEGLHVAIELIKEKMEESDE